MPRLGPARSQLSTHPTDRQQDVDRGGAACLGGPAAPACGLVHRFGDEVRYIPRVRVTRAGVCVEFTAPLREKMRGGSLSASVFLLVRTWAFWSLGVVAVVLGHVDTSSTRSRLGGAEAKGARAPAQRWLRKKEGEPPELDPHQGSKHHAGACATVQ